MAKTIHSRHNKIFLKKLRDLRESRSLRQADLARLLGYSQGTVSYVERGERRLDVIELRDWLDALDYGFLRFVKELDAELRRLNSLRLRAVPGKAALEIKSPLTELIQSGLPLENTGRRGRPPAKSPRVRSPR